ncbi:MAG TPA: hypothetical protein VH186_08780 [Chloroflexia bacterium]|nr:hypothetical protein [Chloroflexia bacterium]
MVHLLARGVNRAQHLSKQTLFTLCATLLFPLTFLLYASSLSHNFLTDDYILIAQLHFKQSSFTEAFAYFTRDWGVNDLFYRPLVRLFWSVEYALFKENPAGWHFMGIMLYSLNVVLVYLLARQLTSRYLPAGVAALLFLLHPTHAEPAIWISDQSDLLALAFCMLALISYIRFCNTECKGLLFYGLAILFFTLALLSKESAVPFVIFPFLYELVFNVWNGSLKERLKKEWWLIFLRQVPFGLLLAAYLALRLSIFGSIGGYSAERQDYTPFQFVTSYAGWLLRPLRLEHRSLQLLAGLLIAILIVALLFKEFKTRRKANRLNFQLLRTIIFGLVWLVLFLLPAVTTFLSLRFIYFSTVGLALVEACLLTPLLEPLLQPFSGKTVTTERLAQKDVVVSALFLKPQIFLSVLQTLLLALVLLLSWKETRAFQRSWGDAAKVVPDFVRQLQTLHPDTGNYSLFYVSGLFGPIDLEKDVPPFQVGLNEAVQLSYNNPTIQTVSVLEFKLTDQRLNQSHFFEFANDQLKERVEIPPVLKQRNTDLKAGKQKTLFNWDFTSQNPAGPVKVNTAGGWSWLEGQGNLNYQPGTALRVSLPSAGGGVLRTPQVALPAPKLANFEFTAVASGDCKGKPLNIFWYIKVGDSEVQRTGIPLALQCDGASHSYKVKPADMSVFSFDDTISELRLELPPGLTGLEIYSARLFSLP